MLPAPVPCMQNEGAAFGDVLSLLMQGRNWAESTSRALGPALISKSNLYLVAAGETVSPDGAGLFYLFRPIQGGQD